MLQEVDISPKSLNDYRPIVGDEVIEEIQTVAGPLKGARVLHINATAFGGGVAELLRALVPLMRDAGLDAHWQVILGERRFFQVTKAFHNALQGAEMELTPQMIDIYSRDNLINAELLEDNWDFIMVHDPQPAALLSSHGRRGTTRWIWRCHIDTSTPNQQVWAFLQPFIELYDAAVFTLERFRPADLRIEVVAYIPPSIDPLTPKNGALSTEESQSVIRRFGIDLQRPLITQVSRFDPWKDPLGVIEAYRRVKAELPDVQLALVGTMATDDPEGIHYYARVLRRAGEDYDVHILSNLDEVGDVEVNAFQQTSAVILQKSIREGFGLTVAEAMWKGRPVIGGNAGGIALQILDGVTGFLVHDIQETAQRIFYLLRDPQGAEEMGARAREHVRQNFLSTRQLRDYLRLFRELS